MKYVSTFAGIGGFDLAFNRASWSCEAMVEWDPACQKVLRQHFPTIPLLGDISDVTGTQVGRPDLAVGGFPLSGHLHRCTSSSRARRKP